MITAATRAMNASSHTLGDLQSFAQADPAEATAYLRNVRQTFVAAGAQVPAPLEAAIDAILNGPPNELGARITNHAAALSPFFPSDPAMWAQLQAQRVQTIGWTAGTPVPQQALSGVFDGNAWTLTTPAGGVYKLAPSPLSNQGGMPPSWMVGFKADGDQPMTVRGTLGSDGKTFLVDDYSPGTSTDFTSGRVNATTPNIIDTARGPVRVTDPAFAAKLAKLPRLGVILPGAPVKEGNELVYRGNPEQYYALGRFGTFPGANTPQGAVTTAQAQVDQAQANVTAYQPALQQQQQQLATVEAQVTAATQAAQQARDALAAATAAQQAAQQAQTAALQELNAVAADPARLAQLPQAQQAFDTANATLTQAAQAVPAAQNALAQADANVTSMTQQRDSARQIVDAYSTALAQFQTQLTTAQAALAQAQAAVGAPAQQDPNAIITGATGDFAYSTFSQKPINIAGAKEATRANHNDRMWALGSFTFDAAGTPVSFEAKYLSMPLGGGAFTNPAVPEADEWLAAVGTTEAGVEPPAPKPIGADFVRHTP